MKHKSIRNGSSLRFIDNSPIGQDLLESQAQEQIADSIAKLIDFNDNQAKDHSGGKQIKHKLLGLDGPWGAGKSNLVKILESKLEKTHHFFIYDAWGHQEDLQRRSFLEELTEDLCSKGIVDPDIWNEKLKGLLSKKQETLTKTIPWLSGAAIVTISVIVLTPVAEVVAEWCDNPVWDFFIALTPILIGSVFAYLKVFRETQHRPSIADIVSGISALHRGQDSVSETQVAIFEKEPSVREFQDWIADLSRALTDKKLVVVFDNMDRLPPNKVLELWSSIHTFFAETSIEGVWVIVPFDRKHIMAAFPGQSEEVPKEFLKKSFSVIYRVAPPVLTDWQEFFNSKFKEAFGETEEGELQYSRKIFDRFQAEITPRGIIAFINEMVSLRLIVGEEILLRYIAIFVLAKEEILADPVNQILERTYLGGAKSLFAEDENLSDSIAALVYHTPLASASQVALTREIQIALNNRDDTRLNNLASHPHFVNVLEKVIQEYDLDVETTIATIAMLKGQDLNAPPLNRITGIWDDLSAKVIESPLLEQDFTDAHKLLLLNCSNLQRVRLVKFLVKGIATTKEFNGGKYYRALAGLDECIQQNDLDIDVLSIVPEMVKYPETFVDYVNAAQSDYKKFRLTCNESKLLDYIVEKIPDNLDELSALSFILSDYDITPVIPHLEEEIVSDHLTAQNVGSFYDFYKALSKQQPIKMISSSSVANLLLEVENGSEIQFDLLAMRVVMGSEFPSIEDIHESILTDTSVDMVNHIAERIEYYETYGDLLLSNLAWPQPILKAVLRKITLESNDDSLLYIPDILPHYADLQLSLDIKPETFMRVLDGWSESAEQEITIENILECVTDHKLLEHALEVDCALSHYLIEILIQKLNSLSIAEWRQAIQDETSFICKAAYSLLNTGRLHRVPVNAVRPYRERLVQVARDESQMDRKIWKVLYERIDKRRIRPIARAIRDLFVDEIQITPEKFLLFSNMLLSYGDLHRRSRDVVEQILAPVIGDDRCLLHILHEKDKFIPLLRAAGDGAVNFRETIKRRSLPRLSHNKKLGSFTREIGVRRKFT